ncbi:acyltransferase 3 [Anaeromyxobacter dehalogenans 2CP-1]|uniref:Acyltransferase 3 n=1 Tax=Anaeromyxobacter dehalogenans (strain ATCC BAA-258 / DSM 21875 / 2CP-1) TaxID=455488 RepID=B8JFD5_ANAD2|nr:acyltransferase [Anaeromyxobacter dehalogenans]ACL66312.1 acyltransferase 3 [Anaeromyxobacter dehalogenans 2CP-1]
MANPSIARPPRAGAPEHGAGSCSLAGGLAIGRDAGIEALRGLAVLLMVAGHVIGVDAECGLQVEPDSGWRRAYYTLAPVRMPLFTAISGFVYGLHPAVRQHWRRFASGKLRRLLVPLVVVGGAFVVARAIVPGTNGGDSVPGLPWLLIVPYAHFWYLYALAWVFALVGALDAFGWIARRWQLALLLAGALALKASGLLETPILGISHAQYLLPYFVLGLGIQRFSLGRGWRAAGALIAIGTIAVAVHQRHWAGVPWPSELTRYAVSTTIGLAAVTLALVHRVACAALAMLGPFSYGIYLMHVFGTAGSRIVLQRAGVDDLVVLAVVGLAAGIALPVAVELAIARNRYLVLFVLGRRPARGRPAGGPLRLAPVPAWRGPARAAPATDRRSPPARTRAPRGRALPR